MDATKRPIQINPEFANYAEEHGIFDMYKRLMSKLLTDMPEDPLVYLYENLKQENDDLPQVAVIGPPVSGKWCVAHKISTTVNSPHLSPDDILSDAPKELQLEVNRYIQEGGGIPDELWVRLINERLGRYDCKRQGWVLDGFPETPEQAKALQAVGVMPKHVIVLEAPDTLLLERAEGKRVDPETKEVWHKIFDYPTDLSVQEKLVEPANYTHETIVSRLVDYHRHIGGIIQAYKHVYKTVNGDQPKSDVFSQAVAYISQDARSQAPNTPRVLLLGPTGAGKAVQAALIASKYNVINISVPQLIQQAIEGESKLGLAIKPYVEQDITVPDHLLMAVIRERLSQMDALTRGWVMHGFPKNIDQAASLDQDGFKPNRVFFLDVPNDIVLERLTLRATDPVSGERYHMLYNPPITQPIKDRLVQNPRDSEEEVRKRLAAFYAYQEELQDYYSQAARVNADQDPHTVFEYIESTIVNPPPKKFAAPPPPTEKP
ncbi:adenylate kinase 8-like isoform X2 [Watersipora subatra]|uniref:adenylate kinase 8-like isoform X2 n=1 Tax=Watersipora subatra TaxID=2589382 RepID=UPI00355AF151